MTWFDAVPLALVAVAWLVLPGIVITYAAGLRGIAAWGAAPVVSVALVGMTAVAAGKLGIAWSVVLPIVVCVATAAVAVAGTLLLRHRPVRVPGTDAHVSPVRDPDPRPVTLAAAAGLLPAFVLGAVTIVRGMGRPDNLSQTFDALFHYNAVASILDTLNASSLTLGGLGNPNTPANFYPGGWHGFTSLLVMTTGTGIPTAANMISAGIAVVVWPLSCLLLARQVFGPSPAALAITGVLSTGFTAFPWGLLGFGVLWPTALGMALVPAGLAAVVSLAGLARDDAIGKARALLLMPVVGVAALLANPGVLFSLIVFSIFPLGAALLVRAWRLHKAGRSVRGGAEVLTVTAVLGGVWYWTATTPNPTFANVRTSFWPPFETPSRAVGEVLLNAPNGRSALWLLSVVVLVGVVAAVRSARWRWLVAGHAAAGFLYLVAAALNRPDTQKFTGYWYNDSFRLAAMLPITGVMLATAGTLFLADKVVSRTADAPAVASRARLVTSATAVTIALVALLVAATSGMYQYDRTARLARPYLAPPAGDVLADPDQRAFFARIKDQIPEGAVVANNPWDGSGLLWALADRRTLFPHFIVTSSPDELYLAQHLISADIDPKVCEITEQLNVEYLLIGDAEFWPWDPRRRDFPGLADPHSTRGFQLVDSNSGAKLYRITACSARQADHAGTDGASAVDR